MEVEIVIHLNIIVVQDRLDLTNNNHAGNGMLVTTDAHFKIMLGIIYDGS